MPWYSAKSQLQMARRHSASLPVAAITIIVAGAVCLIGGMLFVRGQELMRGELRERLRSTAAAAALQFDGDVVDAIRTSSDTQSASFRNIIERLQAIRSEVPNVRYAYIMRQTDDPDTLTFVADADMLRTPAELDVNENGMVDPDEEPSAFDERYDISDIPTLQLSAFSLPSVDEEVTQDRWGALISGYAPIRSSKGVAVATLGLDMNASEYAALSQNIFSPVAMLLLALAAVTIGSSLVLLTSHKQMEAWRHMEAERSGLLRLAFHQLGGPLSIIKWSLELLHEDAPPAVAQVLGNMDEGVKRLNNILHTLHEADLVHEGKVQYKPEVASLNDIVRSVVEEFSPTLQRRKQRVSTELDAGTPMRLDTKLIAGVIRELLNNAVDFSFDGGEISIRTSRQGAWAELEMTDHGCGIPKQDLPRIFLEFERGSNAPAHKPDGSGLGLYIVRGIVRRAGGTIDIQSREGEGTTVIVRLPIGA